MLRAWRRPDERLRERGDKPSDRLIFEHQRQLAPPDRKGTITIEPPPELPRVIRRRCCVLPYLIVI